MAAAKSTKSTKTAKKATGPRPVAVNRRARHDFDILDTFEAGLALQGSEVKSIRDGKVQLKDSYARVDRGEAWLHGMHVAPYVFAQGGFDPPDPERSRKLLLHRREINELGERTSQEGLTIIPLAVYFKEGRAKVELGLARGRHTYDKRHALAERDAKRELDRAVRDRERG